VASDRGAHSCAQDHIRIRHRKLLRRCTGKQRHEHDQGPVDTIVLGQPGRNLTSGLRLRNLHLHYQDVTSTSFGPNPSATYWHWSSREWSFPRVAPTRPTEPIQEERQFMSNHSHPDSGHGE